MPNQNSLTAARLRELLDYDPATGVLRWREQRGPVCAGGVAGTLREDGRRRVEVDGHRCLAHRLAWLHTYGEWPTQDLDHLNGDPDDNRIANLREATQMQNQQNVRGPRRDNTSGFLGVWRERNRWTSKIRVNGQRRRLGLFDTPEEASAAYEAAKRELHPFWANPRPDRPQEATA